MGTWNEHMDESYLEGRGDGRLDALIGGAIIVGLGAIWYGLKYIFTDHKAKEALESVRALNEQLDDLKRQMPQLASGTQQGALPDPPDGV